MSSSSGLALIITSIVLAFFGFVTLFAGIGIVLLAIAFILFIVGIVLVAEGDHAPHHPVVIYPQPAYYPPAQPMYPPTAFIPAPPAPSQLPAERFCPVCGAGNLRASAYCHKCGKALPPPP